MLVILKVSKLVIAALAARKGELESWHDDHDHASYNYEQSLQWDEKKGTVTYEGQRHPLWQDGLGVVLGEALTGLAYPGRAHWTGGMDAAQADAHRAAVNAFWRAANAAFAAAPVLVYKTSDSRLFWWETLDSYLATRAPVDEAVEAAIGYASRFGWSSPEAAIAYFGERLGDVVRATTLSPARANAEFCAETVTLGRRLKAACTGVQEFWRTA